MSPIDWTVIAAACIIPMVVGLLFARRSSRRGSEGYFTGGRDVPWWAIGLSNTATYQSGNGAFVMILLVYGLAGNWLWWAGWIIWMPLVAIVWARLWRRMRIVTTAELISLRYGGAPAALARKIYAFVSCFGFSVLVIGYITGFFAKTIAPLVPLSTLEILLIFGGATVLYTAFGGFLGVVYSDVVQFIIMLGANALLLWILVPQQGGWEAILDRVAAARPEGLAQIPPTTSIEGLTVLILVLQGWFFAGSPTAGEGMTAQRFMAARSEGHAVGGQIFNAFLALTLRTLPLIGLGIVALSVFWTSDPQARLGPAPPGFVPIDDPAHAWGELVRRSRLPAGLAGLLVAAEAAAYMSTLSSLLNWGSSFVVNDLLPARTGDPGRRAWVSRLTTFLLFILAAGVTLLFVDDMVSWFLFINSAMVVFLLPLCWFRFFWWRFNVWGELSAIILGLPLSIGVWFLLGFKDRPLWQGLGSLFLLSFLVLTMVTILTPPESLETLRRFHARCRPPGFWGPVLGGTRAGADEGPPLSRILADSVLGILACLGLVLATNAIFVGDWITCTAGSALALGLGAWLILRIMKQPAPVGAVRPEAST